MLQWKHTYLHFDYITNGEECFDVKSQMNIPAWSILKLLGKRKNESEIPLSGIQDSKLSDSIFSFGRKSLGSQVSSSLSVFYFHVVLELVVSGMENKR